GLKTALGRKVLTELLNGAAPAEVARQIPGCDALESPHPVLEAAGVGVDVLDVETLVCVLAAAGDDRDVQYVLGVRKGAVGVASIADENRILGNDWREVGSERASLQIGEHLVGGGTAAVAHDQDAVVLLGGEPLLGLASALSRGAANEPLGPLRRFADEGF